MLALALGMLAKPTAVVTPIIALLLDIGIIRCPIRDVMRCVWPMFLLAVPCVIWTRTAQPESLGAHVPLWLRPLIAADAMAFYLWKLVYPAALGVDYGRNPTAVLASAAVLATWLVPAAIAAAL